MKGRVLVIDDEDGDRRNVTSGLTREGYDVTACPDGISAIHELMAAGEKGKPYTHLVTDVFMPDIDGLKILKVIKIQYPNLPVLVITGFGDEGARIAALAEHNTAFLDKPFEVSDLVKALEELSPGSTMETGKLDVVPGMRESATAYLTIRISEPARSMDIFKELHGLDGVERCEAVRGDFDIVVVAQGGSREEIGKLKERIGAIRGVEILSVSDVERPKLDRDVDEFVRIYAQAVKTRGVGSSNKQPGRTSYIIVDIDRNAIQQIFTTVFFIDDVFFCDVIEDGAKLVGMVTGQGAAGTAPRIIDKLAGIDGVLRVREAAVIPLVED